MPRIYLDLGLEIFSTVVGDDLLNKDCYQKRTEKAIGNLTADGKWLWSVGERIILAITASDRDTEILVQCYRAYQWQNRACTNKFPTGGIPHGIHKPSSITFYYHRFWSGVVCKASDLRFSGCGLCFPCHPPSDWLRR